MLKFIHANANVTGSRLVVEAVPAVKDFDGMYKFTITPQSSASLMRHDGTRSRAGFPGKSAFFRMSPNQAAHLMLVLSGKAESINNGKGAFDNGNINDVADDYASIFHCDRTATKPYGYDIHIIMKTQGKTVNGRITLNPTEAYLLLKSIENSIGRICYEQK